MCCLWESWQRQFEKAVQGYFFWRVCAQSECSQSSFTIDVWELAATLRDTLDNGSFLFLVCWWWQLQQRKRSTCFGFFFYNSLHFVHNFNTPCCVAYRCLLYITLKRWLHRGRVDFCWLNFTNPIHDCRHGSHDHEYNTNQSLPSCSRCSISTFWFRSAKIVVCNVC